MHISGRLASRLPLFLLAIGVAACSNQRATYVPDGRRGFVIECGGLLSNWSSCLVKAGRACGSHGYDTIKGSEEDRSILIACKVPGVAGAPLASH
jgi:hypothetical protein